MPNFQILLLDATINYCTQFPTQLRLISVLSIVLYRLASAATFWLVAPRQIYLD